MSCVLADITQPDKPAQQSTSDRFTKQTLSGNVLPCMHSLLVMNAQGLKHHTNCTRVMILATLSLACEIVSYIAKWELFTGAQS